uniref:Nucleotid_trans domain-containing protein n=1 Tax=Meloidogyne hapla TaxID=6305 RepID=A0A1I8C288_MELHA
MAVLIIRLLVIRSDFILNLRNDNDCEEVYNRTTVFCYTRMPRANLWEYVEKLELLTSDRQALFFKIDVDIFAAPDSLPDLKDWYILSVVLKAHIGPFSFGILVKLFYELFPLKLMVDFSSTKMFISSGSLTNDGKSLGASETEAFLRLSSYHQQMLINSMEVAESFKAFSTSQPSEVLHLSGPSFLVELASRYNIMGGYWIMFFQNLEISKRESAFNLLLEAAYKNWGPISRFNAKIATDNFIICFGNKTTTSVMDPTNLNSFRQKNEMDDPGALKVRQIVDKIYAQNSFCDACCVQRDHSIRPTVYQATYEPVFNNNNNCS